MKVEGIFWIQWNVHVPLQFLILLQLQMEQFLKEIGLEVKRDFRKI